jgi:hypothetical protein
VDRVELGVAGRQSGGRVAVPGAVEDARDCTHIARQLGHTNLGITSIYLQGIDSAEIIDTVHARSALISPRAASSASSP